MADKKIKTGISISEELLKECDEYLSASDTENRSELIEKALRFYLATRAIKDKSAVLVPELAECIAKANDDAITKLSKGMFRYAVEVEMMIMMLSEIVEVPEEILEEYRKEAVRNVQRTRGKIHLDDLLTRDNRRLAEQRYDESHPTLGRDSGTVFYMDDDEL